MSWIRDRTHAPARPEETILTARHQEHAVPTVTANGTELYHEVRGTGPAVLLIMGATGDGGHLDALAERLADEFTVISYDRRGNGRSPAPAGWDTTSPESRRTTRRPYWTPSGSVPRRSTARAAVATSRCVW